MARMRKILTAGAMLALVGAAACSDRNIVGPDTPRFDRAQYVEDWLADHQPVADDAATRYVPKRKQFDQ